MPIQNLRRKADRLRILEQGAGDLAEESDSVTASYFAGEVRDDMLRMLFVCCDEDIPRESQLVLALKTLCGFSTAEIALRLFTTEANVHKRLGRARDRLRERASRPSSAASNATWSAADRRSWPGSREDAAGVDRRQRYHELAQPSRQRAERSGILAACGARFSSSSWRCSPSR